MHLLLGSQSPRYHPTFISRASCQSREKRRVVALIIGIGIAAHYEAPSAMVRVMELLFYNLWSDPINANSRTAEKLGHIDFGMVVPPARAFFYYSIFPFLVYPIAALHAFGYYRCLRTTVRPGSYRKKRYEDGKIYYGVQRRTYDARMRKLVEYVVETPAEIHHALEVTNGVRNEFIDDPTKPGQAYFVVEQKVMRGEAVFTAENWGYAVISDVVRFLVPVVLAYMFHVPLKRFAVDVKLWREGRLHWRQIRHPVLNFFSTYQDFRIATRRVNVVTPKKGSAAVQVHKPRSPWT